MSQSQNSRDEIIRSIAEGPYGNVLRACDTMTKQTVAIKSINITEMHEGVPSSIIREVSLLKELEDENIVRLLDVDTDMNGVNLVMEFVDTDLDNFIHKSGNSLDQHLIKVDDNIFYSDYNLGIAYCHSNKILHRDLKPANLLVDVFTRKLKIADFGLARAIGIPSNILTSRIGTLYYRAPEILLGSTNYSEAVDIWAVGCIFAEMVIKKPLFYGMCNGDILLEIFKVFGVPTEDTWPGLTSLQKDLSTTYKISPADRKNLTEIVNGIEPSGLELLKLMLSVNPVSRITAHMALSHYYFRGFNLLIKNNSPKSHLPRL